MAKPSLTQEEQRAEEQLTLEALVDKVVEDFTGALTIIDLIFDGARGLPLDDADAQRISRFVGLSGRACEAITGSTEDDTDLRTALGIN